MAARILIHACPQRMWYVNDYLTPSIKAQGLDDITVWLDTDGKGNLFSCMDCFMECGDAWHLQDDVLISHDFGEVVREFDDGIVCGFCHTLFEPFNRPMVGEVPAIFMYNSFPCIRIPGDIARECAEWFYTDAMYRDNYQEWVKSGKHDDGFWHDFIIEKHGNETVMNLAPCIVEHVDWIIGGSIANDWRGYICRASYWEDEYLVDELISKLAPKKGAFLMATRALNVGKHSRRVTNGNCESGDCGNYHRKDVYPGGS